MTEWSETLDLLHGVDLECKDHRDTVSEEPLPPIFTTLAVLRKYELRGNSLLPTSRN